MLLTLQDLGWSPFFSRQTDGDPDLTPLRIAEVHRDRLTALGADGDCSLMPSDPAGDYAVGDWVLSDGTRAVHRLDRQTELSRRAAGTDARVQLIAANVDTLFITTSCNADFNPARLERYLALAADAGCFPVVVLTKADLADDPRGYEREAEALQPMLTVLAIDARDAGDIGRVMDWCGKGQTAALVGSSGVGKTTLTNAMTGAAEAVQGIREDDAKGRHTTTARALRRMVNGGWLIDTPGMRALRLADAGEGIDALFADIGALAQACRFSDCQHETEPGCAVRAAIEEGRLDEDRLRRWRKLKREDARNSETIAEARARDKGFGKMIREVKRDLKTRKGDLRR